MNDDLTDLMADPEQPRRGRGRPKGAKNKKMTPLPFVPPGPRAVPTGHDPMDDYRHADPLAIVSRQYAMLDWAQQALRNQIKIGMGHAEGLRVSPEDVRTLMDLSATTIRALDGHKRALALAQELASQKTPAELLEIAINKVLGQDLPTLQSIIRRLREHRAKLAPIAKRDEAMMAGVYKTAVSAVASLEDEPNES